MATDPNDLRVETLAKEEYLKPAQRQELQENIARDEGYLRGQGTNGQPLAMVPGIPLPDASMVRENMARDKAMLEAGTPPKLTPLQIRQHMRRLDELEAEIKPGMPSIDQMWRPLAPNVDICIAHGRVNKSRIKARKNVLSRLDPDNEEPNFRSVELLRSNDPPQVDLRQYWRNYELIKWQKDAVIEVEDLPMDDETFLRFCQFKAADCSPKLIMRDLSLSKVQYEQAMTRLRALKASMVADVDEDEEVSPPASVTSAEANGHEPSHDLAWLKAEIQRRRIIHRSIADAVGLDKGKFAQMIAGRQRCPAGLIAQIEELLAKFDQGGGTLRVHEMPVAS